MDDLLPVAVLEQQEAANQAGNRAAFQILMPAIGNNLNLAVLDRMAVALRPGPHLRMRQREVDEDPAAELRRGEARRVRGVNAGPGIAAQDVNARYAAARQLVIAERGRGDAVPIAVPRAAGQNFMQVNFRPPLPALQPFPPPQPHLQQPLLPPPALHQENPIDLPGPEPQYFLPPLQPPPPPPPLLVPQGPYNLLFDPNVIPINEFDEDDADYAEPPVAIANRGGAARGHRGGAAQNQRGGAAQNQRARGNCGRGRGRVGRPWGPARIERERVLAEQAANQLPPPPGHPLLEVQNLPPPVQAAQEQLQQLQAAANQLPPPPVHPLLEVQNPPPPVQAAQEQLLQIQVALQAAQDLIANLAQQVVLLQQHQPPVILAQAGLPDLLNNWNGLPGLPPPAHQQPEIEIVDVEQEFDSSDDDFPLDDQGPGQNLPAHLFGYIEDQLQWEAEAGERERMVREFDPVSKGFKRNFSFKVILILL